MRILLLSDIHGKFSLINQLVAETGADAVIIAGDLQLESHDLLDNLSNWELNLRVKHSPQRELLADIPKGGRERLCEVVQEHALCGEWDRVVAGEITLLVPVYAVWGNHEDASIVRQADVGEIDVPNLTFITGREDFLLDGWIRVSGIGGNLLLNSFLGEAITTPKGKISATLARYAGIHRRWAAEREREELAIFVQHVSPHKDRACMFPLLHICPNLVVSGHMGAPFANMYSNFGPYIPADIERIFADPAASLIRDAKEIETIVDKAEAIERAREYLAAVGTEDFEAGFLAGDEIASAALEPHINPKIPDPERRYSVALRRATGSVWPKEVDPAAYSRDHIARWNEQLALLRPPRAFAGIDPDPSIRHKGADKELKKTSFCNLPDAPNGYVVLEAQRTPREIRVESFGSIH